MTIAQRSQGRSGRRRGQPGAPALSTWVERDPQLHELALRVDRLVALQQAFTRACPGAPATVCRLDDAGVLTLRVEGAAWQTRLRQQMPSIVAALTRQGFPVTALKLRVHRHVAASHAAPAPRAPLSQTALESLRTLSDRVQSGPLRDALSALITRHASR